MLIFVADNDFNENFLRAVLRARPEFDVVRARELGIGDAPDSEILTFATALGRIVLTHDCKTMPRALHERALSGIPTSGIVVVPKRLPIREAVQDILLIAVAADDGDLDGLVLRLPIRASARPLHSVHGKRASLRDRR
jgi:hypothetical protein